jgi:hypothetical protein
MTLFKFKHAELCNVVLHVKTVGGIIRNEFVCDLPKGHEGNHHGIDKHMKETLVWVNNDKFMEDHLRQSDPVEKRKIFLLK